MENDLRKKIDKVEYVSFDVFDTLVFRKVNCPTDVFKIIDRILKDRGIISEKANFVYDRIDAQKNAYLNSNKEEITLDEIYDFLDKNEYGKDLSKIKQIEISTEIDCVYENLEMQEIFNYCLKKNKKVIISSDMYLPKNAIDSILKKCGYTGFECIFVSSECICRKSTGRLFKKIINELDINKYNLLHIGDNKKSDYLVPKMIGIKVYHYKQRKINYLFPSKSVLDRLAYSYYPDEQSEYFKFGFIFLGPVMFQFCQWLHEKKHNNKVNKLFFLAREGYFIKKCFEICYPEEKDNEYICVSRKSTRLAIFNEKFSTSEIIDMIEPRVNENVENLFEKCGLDIFQYKDILKKYDIRKEDLIKDIRNIEQLVESIKPILSQNAEKEYEALYKYLDSNDFFCENSAVVDIGWKGTMQNTLNSLFDFSQPKIGFYFGIRNNDFNQTSYGFIEDSNEILEAGTILYETLFMPTHGTTIGYEIHEDKSSPIFRKTEFSQLDIDRIIQIQNGAIYYIKMAQKKCFFDTKYYEDVLPVKRLLHLAVNPPLDIVRLLGDLTFYDSFTSKLVCNYSLKSIKNSLLYSGWKIGFLKSVLKLDFFPYLKIYQLLKKKGK